MYSENKRLKVSRLFVLGAGASYSATKCPSGAKVAPLDKDFCQRIHSISTLKPKWVCEARKLLLASWKDHRKIQEFGLEEAITIQLGHLDFINQIHKRRRTRDSDYRLFLRYATHLISHVLESAQESSKMQYKKIYDMVCQSPDSRVITFNYDTLLDHHFLQKLTPQQVYFDNIQNSLHDLQKRRTKKFPYPILLKMHGSINWLCDQEEFEKIIAKSTSTIQRIENIWIHNGASPALKSNYSPCLVPPLPNKPITKIEIFEYIWTRAAEYLSEAEEIIICGYSLPQTDNLATSLFSNFVNKRLKKIVVIDPNPSIHMRWKALLGRPKLGDIKKPRWDYFYSMQEYLEEGEQKVA